MDKDTMQSKSLTCNKSEETHLHQKCIMCTWCHQFIDTIFDKLENDTIMKKKWIEFDMEYIIPFLRSECLLFFQKEYKIIYHYEKEIKETKNNQLIIKILKYMIQIKNESGNQLDKTKMYDIMKKNNGMIALEFIKSNYFKFLISCLQS